MKKVLIMLALISTIASATEKFSEFYVMEKVLPQLSKAQSYTFDGKEYKVVKVDKKILKALDTSSDPFYYTNSKKETKMVRIGDYIITPMTFSEIDSIDMNYFKDNFIKK